MAALPQNRPNDFTIDPEQTCVNITSVIRKLVVGNGKVDYGSSLVLSGKLCNNTRRAIKKDQSGFGPTHNRSNARPTPPVRPGLHLPQAARN